jgi:hypothetical protein
VYTLDGARAESIRLLRYPYRHSIQGSEPLLRWLWFSSLRIDIVWICTAAFFSAMVWYRRKKRVELSRLFTLRSEITRT